MPSLPVARRSIAIALCLLAGFSPPATLSAQQAAAPPQWFRNHLAEMVSGSGCWIADNSPWRSEKEPFDLYGTGWRYGPGPRRSYVWRRTVAR